MLEGGLSEGEALSEAKENLGPGTDTTSASLAHILWALAHSSDLQAALRVQVEEYGFPQALEQLEAIPLLSACVKEGVRWTGAAAATLPRITPPGGAELAGKFVPAGVSRETSLPELNI